MNYTALNTYLEPLQELLHEDGVNELSINKEQEVWVEKMGEVRMEKVQELTLSHLNGMAQLIAQSTSQKISSERPLLSATIPSIKYRVQIVLPPACESITFAIRKPSILQMSLDDYEASGAFSEIMGKKEDTSNQELKELLDAGRINEFLKSCVKMKKNLIISGGTSTGKTTFGNAVLQEIPTNERIVTVEDAREIQLNNHPNRVHLIASKGGQGLSKVSVQDLIEVCLRIRPDRIIVGELRGAEAFSFLRAINTGHPGSIATLHADSCRMAIEQLTLMVLQSDIGIPVEQIRRYIFNIIDVIVQLKRDTDGTRKVSDILMMQDIDLEKL